MRYGEEVIVGGCSCDRDISNACGSSIATQTTTAMTDRLAKAPKIHLQLSYSIARRAGESMWN